MFVFVHLHWTHTRNPAITQHCADEDVWQWLHLLKLTSLLSEPTGSDSSSSRAGAKWWHASIAACQQVSSSWEWSEPKGGSYMDHELSISLLFPVISICVLTVSQEKQQCFFISIFWPLKRNYANPVTFPLFCQWPPSGHAQFLMKPAKKVIHRALDNDM